MIYKVLKPDLQINFRGICGSAHQSSPLDNIHKQREVRARVENIFDLLVALKNLTKDHDLA